MPFKIRLALVLLEVGHTALGPYGFPDYLPAGIVAGVAAHEGHLRLQFPDESHLAHELHGAVQTEGSVPPVGVEVHLGGYAPLA